MEVGNIMMMQGASVSPTNSASDFETIYTTYQAAFDLYKQGVRSGDSLNTQPASQPASQPANQPASQPASNTGTAAAKAATTRAAGKSRMVDQPPSQRTRSRRFL